MLRKRVSKSTGKVSWQVQIPVGENPEGKRLYLRKTFKYQRDAKAFINDKLQERDSGGVVLPAKMTLNQYLDHWLATAAKHSLRENSYEGYVHQLKLHIREPLGPRRIDQLTTLAIQRAYSEMQDKGLSPRTVRLTHSILHSALDQAVKWRLLSSNPSDGVLLPKKKSREMRPLTQDETKVFLDKAQSDRLAAFFELALTTGMRPGELCGLKWDDVDFDDGAIRVQRTLVRDKNGWYLRDPKTARGKRLIPIPQQTIDALRAHKARQAKERMKHAKIWRDHGFVFCSVIGEPLERHNIINRHFKPILMKVATEMMKKATRASSRMRSGVKSEGLVSRKPSRTVPLRSPFSKIGFANS
jgi:integrase